MSLRTLTSSLGIVFRQRGQTGVTARDATAFSSNACTCIGFFRGAMNELPPVKSISAIIMPVLRRYASILPPPSGASDNAETGNNRAPFEGLVTKLKGDSML